MRKIWSEQTQNSTGLPRPIAKFGNKFKTKNGNKYLFAETPIPFQTSATPNDDFPIDLIQENEDKIYPEGLCAYCGLGFENDEPAIRWTKDEETLHERIPFKVPSDYHPFHIECMRQTRVYCPHMRETFDSEFETGTYAELRSNADKIYKDKHD